MPTECRGNDRKQRYTRKSQQHKTKMIHTYSQVHRNQYDNEQSLLHKLQNFVSSFFNFAHLILVCYIINVCFISDQTANFCEARNHPLHCNCRDLFSICHSQSFRLNRMKGKVVYDFTLRRVSLYFKVCFYLKAVYSSKCVQGTSGHNSIWIDCLQFQ